MANAGDLNNDGLDDIVIGALFSDGNGYTDDGAIYVFPGTTFLTSSMSVSPYLRGNQSSSRYGYSVAGAGDVNSDGYDDAIVGAEFYDYGQNNEGLAFVYHGSSTGLSTTVATTLQSNENGGFLGGSVAGRCDTNGDGYDDVIVGAVGINNGGTDRGRVLIYPGSASGVSSTALATINGSLDSSDFGGSVACANDIDGDGYADILVGSERDAFGAAYMYRGSSTGPSSPYAWFNRSSSPSLDGVYYGASVAGLGDTNADGKPDVAIGAADVSTATDPGYAHIYLGL